jgi:transcriptional regulator with XRE-family HTH domain
MPIEDIKATFSKNLKYFLELNDKQPVDLVNDLKLPFSTVSNWVNGTKMPRMGNVELLAKYFGIEKSDLLEEKAKDGQGYYINPETAEIAQQVFQDPDLRLLFEAARDVKPENIRLAAEMLRRFKQSNPDG